MITSAGKEHIPQIVKIHCESLPDDFLPRLGSSFLKETLYPAVIKSKQAQLFIEVDKRMIVSGFAIITLDSGEFFSDVIKSKFWSFAITGIRSSFRSFKQFRENMVILISSLFLKESGQSGEIYIIAVDKSKRGKGIGEKLIYTAEKFLIENNLPAIKIKTLSSNTNWINHFLKSGWKITHTFSLIGNVYTVLEKKLI